MHIKKGERLGVYIGPTVAYGKTPEDVKRMLDRKFPDQERQQRLELLITESPHGEWQAHNSAWCPPMSLINSREHTNLQQNCTFDNRFVVATCDISAGTEILTVYGKEYWNGSTTCVDILYELECTRSLLHPQ